MNKLINDFIEYLYNIGFLSNGSLGKFIAMNSTRNDNLNIEESFIPSEEPVEMHLLLIFLIIKGI